MEYWLDENWNLVVIDELLTPDSSRFWKLEWFEEWKEPGQYDKQIVRDYVELFWKNNPDSNWKCYGQDGFIKYPVELPEEIISRTWTAYAEMRFKFAA